MVDDALRERILALVHSHENPCFGCSPFNTHGLHLEVRQEGEWATATFDTSAWQQGWSDVVHGGILAALLDEVMGYVLFWQGIIGVTARMDVRYRAGVHVGDTVEVRAHAVHDTRRVLDVEAHILRGERIVTEATGRFIKVGPLFDQDGQVLIGRYQKDME